MTGTGKFFATVAGGLILATTACFAAEVTEHKTVVLKVVTDNANTLVFDSDQAGFLPDELGLGETRSVSDNMSIRRTDTGYQLLTSDQTVDIPYPPVPGVPVSATTTEAGAQTRQVEIAYARAPMGNFDGLTINSADPLSEADQQRITRALEEANVDREIRFRAGPVHAYAWTDALEGDGEVEIELTEDDHGQTVRIIRQTTERDRDAP